MATIILPTSFHWNGVRWHRSAGCWHAARDRAGVAYPDVLETSFWHESDPDRDDDLPTLLSVIANLAGPFAGTIAFSVFDDAGEQHLERIPFEECEVNRG